MKRYTYILISLLVLHGCTSREEPIINSWELVTDEGGLAVLTFDRSGMVKTIILEWYPGSGDVVKRSYSWSLEQDTLTFANSNDTFSFEVLLQSADSLVLNYIAPDYVSKQIFIPKQHFNVNKNKQEIINSMIGNVYSYPFSDEDCRQTAEFLDDSTFIITRRWKWSSHIDMGTEKWEIMEHDNEFYLVFQWKFARNHSVFQINGIDESGLDVSTFWDYKKKPLRMSLEKQIKHSQREELILGKWVSTLRDTSDPPASQPNLKLVEFETYEFFRDHSYVRKLFYETQEGPWQLNEAQSILLLNEWKGCFAIKRLHHDTLELGIPFQPDSLRGQVLVREVESTRTE